MKDSLLNLQRGIGIRDYSSEAEEKRSRYHWHTATRPWGHAVQYRTCFVCASVCRKWQDRERGHRGMGPTVSRSNRDKEWNSRLRYTEVKPPPKVVPLCTDRNWAVSSITEGPREDARLVTSLHLWDKRFLPLSFDSFPSASYCKPCEWVAERKKENYSMHLDNITPLSQC